MRQILLTMLIVGVANVLHAADSSVPKTAYKKNSAMELLFESRTEITKRTGKIYFFQRKPRIHPESVLGPDSFVDGAGTMCYGTVLRENGIFRMWYQAWPRDWKNGSNSSLIGYAESDDGLAWRKPKLGLVDYAGKGTDNNLVDIFGHSFTVFIDPDAPAGSRYRATMCIRGGGGYGYYTAHSADGLKWEYDQPVPQWKSSDVITSIYHPGQRRGIVALKVRPYPYVNGIPRRSIGIAELRDGRWSEAHSALLPDELADTDARSRGYPVGDYYGMGMMPAGSGTVGFLWQFRHSGMHGVNDVTLVYQAGRGEHWEHVPGRPDFISHADPSFGQGTVYTSSCPVTVGDEQWLYFTAYTRIHGWYINNKGRIDDKRMQTVIDEGLSRIGVARWPKWRLFGFRSDPKGSLTLKLDGVREPCRLLLNYECEQGGSVRISLEDVPGRTEKNSIPLTGSSLDAAATWIDGDVLAPRPKGQSVEATLHMDRASVYAYQVLPAG
ncbi:MAG: hypothetical protein ISR77_38055 [Pirellulaceae bacterium]|nr:hypothetical protein [Pirellulaceae bacterium]